MTGKTFPSISVVIPAYNRATTISRCLESVFTQTLSPFEVIVVDDCSDDETVQMVRDYADPRLRCIMLERNSGAQAARNRGIREAKGDWIAFLDSDDEWLPEKLGKQVKVLAESSFDPWAVVHSNAIWLDTTTGKLLQEKVPAVEGADVYPLLLTKPGPLFPGMLVSRLALEKINYLDENVPSYQEWDTSIRLARYCRFIYMREPLFVYHLHAGETISKNKKRGLLGYQYIVDKFEQEIKDVCGVAVWESHLMKQLVSCLNCRLWIESDRYYSMISNRNLIFKILQVCRALHLQPKILSSLKKIFYPDKQRIPAR